MSGKGGLIVVGFGVMWVAYGILWTGYTLVRGYDVPVSEVWSPVNYYKGSWPPPAIPKTQVWPSRSGGANVTAA